MSPTTEAMPTLGGAQLEDFQIFWAWSGRFVGYRHSDCLFSCSGRQVGYFAEGDEVYGCNGDYVGEVRSGNRLITRVSKKAWTRRSLVPQSLKSSPGHADASAKEMISGFEDFPVPQDRA